MYTREDYPAQYHHLGTPLLPTLPCCTDTAWATLSCCTDTPGLPCPVYSSCSWATLPSILLLLLGHRLDTRFTVGQEGEESGTFVTFVTLSATPE